MLRFYLFVLLAIWLPNLSAQVSAPSFCGNESGVGFFEIEVDGSRREYMLHIPDASSGASGLPLIINFHGFGDCAGDYAESVGGYYGLNDLADEAGFVVAYPQAMVREKGDPYWEPGDIGDDIEITIVDIRNEQIKLGINAPNHIKVFRKEVYDAIQEENKAAASTPDNIKGLSDLFKG